MDLNWAMQSYFKYSRRFCECLERALSRFLVCVCFKVLDDFVCGIYSLQPFVGSSRGLSFRRLGPETQSASYGDHMGGCQN